MATHYLRRLNYADACRVIDFINNNNLGYAYITVGGIGIQDAESNWEQVESFIKSVSPDYDISSESPDKVEQRIINNLKNKGVI